MKETSKSTPGPSRRNTSPCIELINVSKHSGYCADSKQVLRDINMSVFSGEIYALLGPHGCGKSTTLDVIMGVTKFDSGQVTVFGLNLKYKSHNLPGIRIGYAPQTEGLHPNMTVGEVLRYYGALLNLERLYISNRIELLSGLLMLPTHREKIGNISESNKRHVSLAVALLHDPELLLLDEPCAEMDPVMKRSTWEYLRTLAQKDKTILITTRNCEEARFANTIGFMRYGRILVQGNPRDLLAKYKEKHLEVLYRRVYGLNLANLNVIDSIHENPIIKLEPLNIIQSEGFMYLDEDDTIETYTGTKTRFEEEKIRKHSNTCVFFSMKRLCILILRECLKCARSNVWIFSFLFLPLIFLIVFCALIGKTPSSLALGVVNLEALNGDCHIKDHLSCNFLNLIDKAIIKKITFKSISEAKLAAENLEVHGILIVSSDFSGFVNGIVSKVVTKASMLEDVPLELSLDTSNKLVSTTIEKSIKDAVKIYINRLTNHNVIKIKELEGFINITDPIFGSYSKEIMQYLAPGMMMTLIYHTASLTSTLSLISNRIRKLTLRDYLTGVQLLEIVLANISVYGVLTLIQSTLLFSTLLAFGIPSYGSIWNIVVLTTFQVVCGVSFGIFVAMISKTTAGAGIWILSSALLSMLINGVQWPIDGLPMPLKIITELFPQTKIIEAVRNVLHRETVWTHQSIWMGIVSSLCWFLVFTIAYIFTYKII